MGLISDDLQGRIDQDNDVNDDIAATPADSAGLTPMRSPAAACTRLLKLHMLKLI